MKTIQLTSHPLFQAKPVRDLFSLAGYRPQSSELQIAYSVVDSLNDYTRIRQTSHLTESTSEQHQIRYALADRVDRYLQKLAEDFHQNFSMVIKEVVISGSYENDFITQKFFAFLSRKKSQIKITWGSGSAVETKLDAREQEVMQLVHAKDFTKLFHVAQRCSYYGDYGTALSLLLLNPHPDQAACHLLGLCYNYFGQTETSEAYFEKVLMGPKLEFVVGAHYVISMLYLRLHPKEKLNLDVAEKHLQKAYKILLSGGTIPDQEFLKVFNRNGYALCLYRRGQVKKAHDLLAAGIEKLSLENNGARDLHRSVLMYNQVQCLMAMQDTQKAEQVCRDLLDIDPLFPEYHLELARILIVSKRWSDAENVLKKALSLDNFIAETYSLFSHVKMENAAFVEALPMLKKAVVLNLKNQQFKLDLAYCYSELEMWSELVCVLGEVEFSKLNLQQKENYHLLRAESIYWQSGSYEQILNYLKSAAKSLKNSNLIQQNIQQIINISQGVNCVSI